MSSSSGGYLPLADMAARTGRSAVLLRRWCQAGRIPCRRVGRLYLVPLDALAIIEAQPKRKPRREGRGGSGEGG